MAVPTAPTEAGGNSILFLTHDVGGTNTPGILRGVVPRTVNATILSYLGIATHADGGAFVAGDPVVLNGIWESGSPGTVRKMLGDSSGRIITRPMGVYNNGGSNAFGHPHLVGQAALNGEPAGWLGVASHIDGGSWVASGGIVVVGGVDTATPRKAKVDSTGRFMVNADYTFGGHGHVNVAGGPARAALAGSTPCRLVVVKADKGNANTLYLGGASVTADEVAGTGGLQLEPGEASPFLQVANLNALYVHGIAAQGASFMYWT
jgi:hypothetical protein